MADEALDPRPKTASGPRLGRVHDRVLHALAEIDAGAAADKALANEFRRARDLGPKERAQVREEVYGLLRRRRQARDALERGLAACRKDPKLFDPPILLRLELLAHLAVEGASLRDLQLRDRFAARRVPKLFERITTGRLPPAKRGELEAAAVACSFPTWLLRHLVDAFGLDAATTIAEALGERAPLTVRVDPTRLERDAFAATLAERGISTNPTALAPHGLVLEQHVDLRGFEETKDGRVEVQDEGSQLVTLAVGARPGERVLDACAGAGGKTLGLWAAMGGEGELVAIEPDPKKADALRRRLRAAGADGARVIGAQLEALPDALRGRFDRVLVDAPCTGTGTLRRHPDLKWRLDPGDVAREASRQRRLLGAALAALRPGGYLVYATCSVLREENEAVVEEMVKVEPRLDPAPLAAVWGRDLSARLGAGAAARIGPGPGPGGPDGFFVAASTLTDG
jgi:16S rRNA (cytosine967-C5)-methyltransferase